MSPLLSIFVVIPGKQAKLKYTCICPSDRFIFQKGTAWIILVTDRNASEKFKIYDENNWMTQKVI